MTNQPIEDKPPQVCSICGEYFHGMGNNAWPVNPGRCCDYCNSIVTGHRMANNARGLNAYADPEWYQDIVKTVNGFWDIAKEQDAKLNPPDHPALKGLESV